MVKYKINIKFNDKGKSLNEKLTNVLKMELEKKIKYINTHYSQKEGSSEKNE